VASGGLPIETHCDSARERTLSQKTWIQVLMLSPHFLEPRHRPIRMPKDESLRRAGIPAVAAGSFHGWQACWADVGRGRRWS
jgi:hypothetical protein